MHANSSASLAPTDVSTFDRASLDAWRETHAAELQTDDFPTMTSSGLPVEAIYTPLNLARNGEVGHDVLVDYGTRLGLPGEPPFTRGIKPGMYRQGIWVMG